MNAFPEHQTLIFHNSQFPGAVRESFHAAFRSRRMAHKFHYDSYKQTQKWLEVHQAYSPSRTDDDCIRIYKEAFVEVARQVKTDARLISLGCGGGQKDAIFLKALAKQGLDISYTASDVSPAMVLTALGEVAFNLENIPSVGRVCDLAGTPSKEFFGTVAGTAGVSIYSFLGMIPNFEPDEILPYLKGLLGQDDLLVFSANLSPGKDYREGTEKILPLYNNRETREWLQTILFDFGCDETTGKLTIQIEETASKLLRVAATYQFHKAFTFSLDDQKYAFDEGEAFGLFFSYRYTDTRIETELGKYGMKVRSRWITNSAEEGVYLVSL
jgi:L-histidine N-alpha-methyltransferase